ncbi:Uncharacterised protein [Mycobacteroides abscessus subsp. abscessus]|nr:Uncharacterised protein [Mycobacteroides abscessus subsp. abscessus]
MALAPILGWLPEEIGIADQTAGFDWEMIS